MNKVTALLLLLIGLLQYRLWFGDGNVLEFQRLNDHIAELRQEGERRRERNAALEAEVMDLKQGLDAVEERARQDLEMIKEGEVFVQVIDPREPEPPTIIKEKPASPAKPEAAKAGKETKPAKPREAVKPHPTESPAAGKPKPVPAKTDKPQAPKATPKPAKPVAPVPPSRMTSEPLFDDPPGQRPPNDEADQ